MAECDSTYMPTALQDSRTPFLGRSSNIVSSAQNTGNDLLAVANMSRTFTGLTLNISNSYQNLNHIGTLDLNKYSVPGWTLSNVTIDADAFEAIAERERLNVVPNDHIIIVNSTGLVTDVLYQQFYGQPYDGKLENYTILCRVDYYLPGTLGYAYMVVRSDYADPSTNETSWISPFVQGVTDTYYTQDTSGDNAILNASTPYYALIDGQAMNGYHSGTWFFNQISWASSNTLLGLDTGYHLRGDTWYHYIGTGRQEAALNYTYTPWNRSANAPLMFSGPSSVSLLANGTPLYGNTWNFENSGGLSSLVFASNQSVSISYSITVWYRKDIWSSTMWSIKNSGDSVDWNITTDVEYPSLSNIGEQLLRMAKPSDWSPTGLYNSTNPSVDYGTYASHGTYVVCSSMTNGTWTLTSTAFNYLTNIQAPSLIRVDSVVSINLTIQDSLNNPATSGSTNLTIHHEGVAMWTPPNKTVTTGSVTYSSNIGTWVTSNGTHTIEAFWTNGYEAGYLTEDMLVYYPTSLVAASTQIAALIYTGGSFEVRVDFTDTFASTELTATYAELVYSYDLGANVSLNDLGNGTWTADISTAGRTAGQHTVQVYAEGYGIENQTLVIDVSLTYKSLPLSAGWSGTQGNSITYLQSTHLSVEYNFANGTAIQGATVNATDGTTTWPMHWDPVGMNYTIQFNGADFTGLPKTVGLTVTAWKSGHESQAESSLQLIVSDETGTSLSAAVLPTDLSMTYAETLRITANYSYGGSPIVSGIVQVEFNGSYSVLLQYNGSTHLWYVEIPASDVGLGTWSLNISADANGYVSQSTLRNLSVLEDIPTLEASWTDLQATTDYATNITLNVIAEDSLGNPILDADMSVTLLSSTLTMVHLGNGLYSVIIQPEAIRGTHPVVVTLDELGYAVTSLDLNLTILATTELVSAPQFQEYETEQLEIGIQYLDSYHDTPIDWGTVNLAIESSTFSGVWNGSMFVISFPLDYPVGYHSAMITASASGVNNATYGITVQVLQKSYVYLELRYIGDSAEGNQISIEAVLRQNVTDAVIPYANINFEMTVLYDNGTTQLFIGQDSTNEQGVASITFQIPSGTESRITSIGVTATYDGPKRVWDTSKSFVIPVHLGALPQFMNWLFNEDGRYVIILLGIAAVGAYGYNTRVKPKKRARKTALETQLKNFNDLKSIQHFMAVYLNRGTCVFYHPFREGRIQADLISGFISAVTSVYGEIKGNGVQGSLEEIHYHGLRLNSYNGKYVLGILILDEEISQLMRDRLQFFVELFENEYESHLEGWTGLTDCFDPEWIVTNLVSTFGYSWALPHTIRIADKLSGEEKKVINYIKASLGDKREFLIEDYVAPIAELLHMTKAEALDVLLRMEEYEIFAPISIQTVLQRQGMGMVATAEDIGELGEIPVESTPEPQESTEESEPTPEEAEPEVSQAEVEEEPSEAPPETQAEEPEEKKEVDAKDAFVAEVESLLKKEKNKEDED
jgi:hypothetical protein